MRYTIVTETYPPEINGVALTVQRLEEGLRSRGHEVGVVRPRQGSADAGKPHETLVTGMPLPRYPGLRFGLPCAQRLASHWRRTRPDAIYVATEGPLGWSALRAARRLGIPAATGLHTRFDEYMRDYGLRFLTGAALGWMRKFHNRGDATVVPTRELAGFLQSNGFGNAVRLPRAVDTARFAPSWRSDTVRKGWGIEGDALAVLYIGRIAAEKNLDLAVRAFRAIQQQRARQRLADARFVWIGDGPERARLQQQNPDFVFCGMQIGEDLSRHCASGDLFVFPSRSETFGNVTLEAMASGVPTVAFDYGAAHEHLRNGIDGFSVTDGDDDGFVSAAAHLATDDDLRRACARACRESVSTLRPEQVAADLDALLENLVVGRNHATVATA